MVGPRLFGGFKSLAESKVMFTDTLAYPKSLQGLSHAAKQAQLATWMELVSHKHGITV